LSTGNTSAINLANNNLDVGDMCMFPSHPLPLSAKLIFFFSPSCSSFSSFAFTGGSNYTLNVVITSTGEAIVGAITPSSTTVQECSPSGFYNINTSNGLFSYFYSSPPPITFQVTLVYGEGGGGGLIFSFCCTQSHG
jgi:hypothetical protein